MASMRGQTQARTPSPSSAHADVGDNNLRVPITRSSTKRACADEFNSSAAVLDKGNKRPALADRTNAEQGNGNGRGSKKQTQGSQPGSADRKKSKGPATKARSSSKRKAATSGTSGSATTVAANVTATVAADAPVVGSSADASAGVENGRGRKDGRRKGQQRQQQLQQQPQQQQQHAGRRPSSKKQAKDANLHDQQQHSEEQTITLPSSCTGGSGGHGVAGTSLHGVASSAVQMNNASLCLGVTGAHQQLPVSAHNPALTNAPLQMHAPAFSQIPPSGINGSTLPPTQLSAASFAAVLMQGSTALQHQEFNHASRPPTVAIAGPLPSSNAPSSSTSNHVTIPPFASIMEDQQHGDLQSFTTLSGRSMSAASAGAALLCHTVGSSSFNHQQHQLQQQHQQQGFPLSQGHGHNDGHALGHGHGHTHLLLEQQGRVESDMAGSLSTGGEDSAVRASVAAMSSLERRAERVHISSVQARRGAGHQAAAGAESSVPSSSVAPGPMVMDISSGAAEGLPSSLSPSLLARDEVLEESQQGAHGSHELNGGAASITSRQAPVTRASVLASVAANTGGAAGGVAGSALVLPNPTATAPAAPAVIQGQVGAGGGGGGSGASVMLGSEPAGASAFPPAAATATAPAASAASGASVALQWQPSGTGSSAAPSASAFPPPPEEASAPVHTSSSPLPADGGQTAPSATAAAVGAAASIAAPVTVEAIARPGRAVDPAPPAVGTTGGMAAIAAALPAVDAGVLHVNIDGNLSDPQQVAIYAPDIYRHLRANELLYRPVATFMESVQRDINSNMRAILIDWLVEVAEEYRLVPDTLYLTCAYIDRYLSTQAVTRNRLQLLGVACMLIASKYEEIYAPQVEEFCYITDNTYARDEVLDMERVVLNELRFELTTATTKSFLRRFVRAAQVTLLAPSLQLEYLGNFLAELTLVEYDCLGFLPSIVAASAVFLAKLTLFPNQEPWNATLCHYTGYQPHELRDCVRTLHDLQRNVRASSLPAIREKYRQPRFQNVASLPAVGELPAHLFE